MIFKNYFLRTVKDPLNFGMLIAFPLVMITIFITTTTGQVDAVYRTFNNGYCLVATGNLMFNALFFQYFAGMIVTDYLYHDFRGDMRWRLMASPKKFGTFVISAILASMAVAALNGVVVITFTRLVFNAYFPIAMTIVALSGMSIFVTLFGVLCFLLIPNKGTTTAVIMVFAFAQMLIFNFGLIPFPEINSIGAASFFPIIAAARAIDHFGDISMQFQFTNPDIGWEGGITMLEAYNSTAFTHLGILGGLIVVTLLAVLIVGRKRKI